MSDDRDAFLLRERIQSELVVQNFRFEIRVICHQLLLKISDLCLGRRERAQEYARSGSVCRVRLLKRLEGRSLRWRGGLNLARAERLDRFGGGIAQRFEFRRNPAGESGETGADFGEGRQAD